MSLRQIPRSEFVAKLWKNGMGTTYDIALLPEGADHHTFEVRFALSPIVKDGVFSQFSGIERVITPIKGNGLHLAFDDHEVTLPRLASHRFDTGLTPMGALVDGEIEVVNVMARRSHWEIVSCAATGMIDHSATEDDLSFVFALTGDVALQAGTETLNLAKHDAVVASGSAHIKLNGENRDNVLFAHLRRADRGR